VSWGHFPNACPGGDAGPAGCAPNNLSQAQLQGIYICDQGSGATKAPKFTNWAQVGGDNEPIRRYLPQTGSGTLSFFETRILGLSSAQQGVVDDSNCTVKPIRRQENDGTQIDASVKAFSIVPYSFAQWTAQANGAVTDIRGGVLLGSINGVAPNAFSITANTFLGTRYVYNVAKTGSPSYARAINFMGVRPSGSGGNGFICADSSSVQSAISHYGFVPLPLASAGAGLPNSRCRKNPAPL
jgi:phosphate transport system substrate-binding protein